MICQSKVFVGEIELIKIANRIGKILNSNKEDQDQDQDLRRGFRLEHPTLSSSLSKRKKELQKRVHDNHQFIIDKQVELLLKLLASRRILLLG